MKNLTFLVLIIFLSLTSCSSNEATTQEEDSAKLEKLYRELTAMSEVENRICDDPNEWSYTKLGDICGGETNLIYYKKINTKAFLKKAATYKRLLKSYNKKWNGPNCALFIIFPGKPTGLDCYNERPRLTYN